MAKFLKSTLWVCLLSGLTISIAGCGSSSTEAQAPETVEPRPPADEDAESDGVDAKPITEAD